MIIFIEKKVNLLSLMLLIYLSSGSLQLFMDGGARQQGFEKIVAYDGPLKLILPIWAVLAVSVISWVFFVRRQARHLNISKLILTLITVSLISAAWSENAYTAIRTSLLIGTSYLLIYCTTYYFSREEILSILCNTLLIMLLASVTLSILVPSYGVYLDQSKLMWQGIFSHKNGLGNFSALSYSVFLGASKIFKSKKYLFGCLLSATLVFMSDSSTSMIATITATIVFFLLSEKNFKRYISLHGNIYLITLLAFSFSAVIVSLATTSVSGDNIFSFSQRNFIWLRVLIKAIERPLSGFGMDQFQAEFLGQDSELSYAMGATVSHAHNGFIEAFFSLGLMGLIISVFLMRELIIPRRQGKYIAINYIFLCTLVVINTLEAQLLTFNIFIVGLFILITQKHTHGIIKPPHTS